MTPRRCLLSMCLVSLMAGASLTAADDITTIAGNGSAQGTNNGDGGPATNARISYPFGLAIDTQGDLFIADYSGNRIRKVDTLGIITTVAGQGTSGSNAGFGGDGGPATAASLDAPQSVAVDGLGDLFIADTGNHRVRKVDASGIITTMAGTGTQGFSGDGGLATAANLNSPAGVAIDSQGNLFIADGGNNRVRKVDASGNITTVAGNGLSTFGGDGGSATAAGMSGPAGVAVDAEGDLFIVDSLFNFRIRKVTGGIITTVAGNGSGTDSGDGGSAITAGLAAPDGVAVDAQGDLFISEPLRIREVTGGIITTVAGNGIAAYSGDGGSPTAASFSDASAITIDAAGDLFISDGGTANAVRRVGPPAPPTINSPTTYTVNIGGVFSYQITATNHPTSFGATPLPAGLSVSATSGQISGSPTLSGTTPVTVTATNATGIGTGVLTVVVEPLVPFITSPLVEQVTVGSSFNYQITATNDPTSFAASGLPTGITINTATGLISGTPTTAGNYPVIISATTGAGTNSLTLNLTVNSLSGNGSGSGNNGTGSSGGGNGGSSGGGGCGLGGGLTAMLGLFALRLARRNRKG